MKTIVAYPPVDFSVPFTQLSPEQIDIYFHYDSTIGASTCKAACQHCYFQNRPPFHIPIDRALAVARSLRKQGYNIGLTPADSFADEALDAGDAGSAFRAIPAAAWTSGMPLHLPGWERRLDRAWAIGFRSIVITAHSAAGTAVPIKGVTKGPVIQSAVRHIQQWNAAHAPSRFAISTTFTINPSNLDLETMRRMVQWGVAEGIDVVRFNCFANFLENPEHERLEMSRDQIVAFYGYLRRLHEEFIDAPTRLGISEDWGDAGIEQIYDYLDEAWRRRTVGWCRAGYRLFAMIEVGGQIVVTGCVDKWAPILGTVEEAAPGEYEIRWNHDKIDELRRAVLAQQVYACWGGVGRARQHDAAGFETDPAIERSIFHEEAV